MQLPNGAEIEILMLCGFEEKIGMILKMPFLKQVSAKINVETQTIKTRYGTYG